MVKKKKKKTNKTKQRSYKKARYMFTIRFLCTVSKKINFPLNDVNKTRGASHYQGT